MTLAVQAVDSKVCGECHRELDANRFSPSASQCRECRRRLDRTKYHADREAGRAQSRMWRERNPEKVRAAKRKHRYGITGQEYTRLLAAQGERCAICRTADPGAGQTWNVDHDHGCCPGERSCGRCVRGLLCKRCNTGVGMFRDDPDRLAAAAAYLIANRRKDGQ